MSETVRVCCAVTVADDGGITVVGVSWPDEQPSDGELMEMTYLIRDDCVQKEWVTVEIPLPVEPVVVAEVEDGDD